MLGSTGSIGTNCLDVVDHLPDRLQVLGLSAHANVELLLRQAEKHRPRWVAVTDADAAARLDGARLPAGCQLLHGEQGVAAMASDPDVDVVLNAIVGAAGLAGAWAALEAGKTVAVANKETLVMAGALVMELAARRGGRLLPVDSEHSAIFQAMQGSPPETVERIVLTGSGGPFRGRSRADLADVDGRAGAVPPNLAHGPQDHRRFGHADEQGAGSD